MSETTVRVEDEYVNYHNSYAQETMASNEDIQQKEVLNLNENTNRKLIKTISMNVETENFDSLLGNIKQRVAALGGYVEQEEINGTSYYAARNNRYASMSLRIPNDQLESFVNEVTEISNVIWKNENVQDVTLQYVDVESHKKALQTEQDRLFELLEKAELIEDIIAIESRLSEIRYELQNYESQLRVMDNQIEYSTISLHIEEVQKLTPQKEKSAWEKITEGFKDSLISIWKGIQNTIINFIVYLPYLILWGIIIIVLILIGRKLYKKRKNNKI